MDKQSFILGMITAFCECVAAGCKDLALSPPLSQADYASVHTKAEELIANHGLISFHEDNPDLPEEKRFEWIVITRDGGTLAEYRALRDLGYNPADSLKPFERVLSYRPEKAVSVRYDAYREFFPQQQCEPGWDDVCRDPDRYEIRTIRADEAEQAAEIEHICFPPNEACSYENMLERVRTMPEMFVVAVDRASGRIVGFINGLATDEVCFRDEFFTNPGLHVPAGKHVMIFGFDILPEHRHRGLASVLMKAFLKKAKAENRSSVLLTCHEARIGMYVHMGFRDLGLSKSVWGGVPWHEMENVL